MSAAGLSPRTVNKYVEFVQQIVASLKGANGEPVHKRVWDAETMDLPILKQSEQKRPSLKADPISQLIQGSSSQEQALYVLLAATGMRVSEALALETHHFINGGLRTVRHPEIIADEAGRVGYGFTLPASNKPSVVPIVPKLHQNKAEEKAA